MNKNTSNKLTCPSWCERTDEWTWDNNRRLLTHIHTMKVCPELIEHGIHAYLEQRETVGSKRAVLAPAYISIDPPNLRGFGAELFGKFLIEEGTHLIYAANHQTLHAYEVNVTQDSEGEE